MDTSHRYGDGAGFRHCQSSGNHWLIWLIGVTGKFASNCVRIALRINGAPAADAGEEAQDRGGLAVSLVPEE